MPYNTHSTIYNHQKLIQGMQAQPKTNQYNYKAKKEKLNFMPSTVEESKIRELLVEPEEPERCEWPCQ